MQKFVNQFLRFLAKLISTVWEIQYLSDRKDFSLTTDKYLNKVHMQFAIYANQIDSSDLNTHLATLFILHTQYYKWNVNNFEGLCQIKTDAC